ncbi:hypothetical protein CBL_01827 [Carabus blaptoides fortunei]
MVPVRLHGAECRAFMNKKHKYKIHKIWKEVTLFLLADLCILAATGANCMRWLESICPTRQGLVFAQGLSRLHCYSSVSSPVGASLTRDFTGFQSVVAAGNSRINKWRNCHKTFKICMTFGEV